MLITQIAMASEILCYEIYRIKFCYVKSIYRI